MEFRVLGGVEVLVGDVPRDLGLRRMDRCLLGILLVHLGTPVPVERLVALLWGDAPPERARQSLHVSVSRLRKALADAPVRLATRNPGYVLDGDPTLVDVHRFRALCEQAHAATDLATRSDLLRAAIALHRGPLLGGDATDQVREVLGGPCAETLLTATELRLSTDLELGRSAGSIEELATLTTAHPLRESLVELRVLALHQAGRREEALDVYREARRTLADELGLDPRPELAELHGRILRAEPALNVTTERAPRPAQLPPGIFEFTGRDDQLAELDNHLSAAGPATGAVLITAITGAGGVGKTALALHWAHQVQGRFPDGQLYVNLHGYSSTSPLRPIEALARFLRALGVAPERIPFDVDEAAALYRSLLADRQMLVVLDNANTPEQLRPLLPGTAGSLALVTSRSSLAGLVVRDGARRVSLDVLPPAEALALLAVILGSERTAAEPGATADLAALCGRLPLALRIAAAALADDTALLIAEFCDRLRGGDRLGALEVAGDEQSSVRATIGLSYAALSPEVARLFCLVGLVPGPSFTAPAAARLADVEPAHAARLLDRLASAHLVEPQGAGHYALHDLVRDYAREQAPPGGPAAVGRLYDWYLRSAHAAAEVIHPQMLRLPLAPSGEPPEFVTHTEALAWFDAERANLVAAVVDRPAGHDPAWSWRIGDALRGYLWLRKLILEWFDVARTGLAAAEAANDPEARISAHRSLCMAHASSCDYVRAADHAQRGLLLSREHGLLVTEASQLSNLANILLLSGNPAAAADTYQDVLRLKSGGPQRVAALSNLGEALLGTGRLLEAADQVRAGLDLVNAETQPNLYASVLAGLGDIHHAAGSTRSALDVLAEAVAVARGVDSVETVAVALNRIARVHNQLGRHAEALDDAHTVRALVSEHRIARLEATALCTLAATRSLLGDHGEALSLHAHSLRLATERNNAFVWVECLLERGASHLRAGRPDDADLDEALESARRHGYALLEAQALDLLAQAHLAMGGFDRAVAMSSRALAAHRRTGHRPGEAVSLVVLGQVTGGLKHWTAARELVREFGGTAHALVAEPLLRAAFADFLA